jgi:hypothetical protein
LQIPEKGLADIADSSHDIGLTGTERPLGDSIATPEGKEVFGDTIRVAIALLARWVVVPFGCTLVTLGPHKVWAATAGASIVARHPLGSGCFTIASWKKVRV